MPTTSLLKNRCYNLIAGIEESLGMILREHTPISDQDYLYPDEHERGLVSILSDFID
jgi:hypothetical protein